MTEVIYIVTSGQDEDYEIVAIHATREAALAHIKRLVADEPFLDCPEGDSPRVEVHAVRHDTADYWQSVMRSYRFRVKKSGEIDSLAVDDEFADDGHFTSVWDARANGPLPAELIVSVQAKTLQQARRLADEIRLRVLDRWPTLRWTDMVPLREVLGGQG